jgi:protein-L-isoaspartate(D-aspartate) O-methyltransferase
VFSVERVPELTREAQRVVLELGIKNVTIMGGDGTLGWRPYAPYDAILVAAASPEVPRPLLEQLAIGGRLVIPIGDREQQVLTLVRRTDEASYETTTLGDVRFVPLIGEHGFQSQDRET